MPRFVEERARLTDRGNSLDETERWAKDQAIRAALARQCGEPNPLRRVHPDWDVTCQLEAGHEGLHQTAMLSDDGTETVSWVWDETRGLLGPAPE